MNNNLLSILETYEKEKTKIRKRIDTNKQTLEKLSIEFDTIFSECASIKDRYNTRKDNKQLITDIENKLAAAYENQNILYTALKLANEMKVKVVGNALRNEILNNPEKWTKYPTHFKKFEEMTQSFLSDTQLYLSHSYRSYYVTGLHDYHDTNAYVFDAPDGIITEKVIEEMKNKQEYPIIKPNDIITECKKAFAARKKIIAKYEQVKKEIDAIRAPFESNTIYYLLPYAPVSMQNERSL